MEEFKKLLFLVFLLILFLLGIIAVYKPSGLKLITRYFAAKEECTVIPYKKHANICLGKDAGIRASYNESVKYCSDKYMRLPTREEAWYIWRASENCNRMFASGEPVAENKQNFMNPDAEKIQSLLINNYCNIVPSIKFAQGLQYNDGFYWLWDFAGGKRHYSINYFNGTVKIHRDSQKNLGVRCVSIEPVKKGKK